MTSRRLDLTSALAFLAEHRRARTEPITERLVATIERDNPPYKATGLVPPTDLWRSCRDNVARVLELLALAVEAGGISGRPDGEASYDAARATGSRRAAQGLPLDDVLRSFRIGGRLIWDDLVEQSAERLDAAAVRDLGTYLWEVVDETSAQVATAYHLQERSLVRADEQQRAQLWEGVLSGRAREPGFAHEAAGLLDLPAADQMVVVVAPELDPRVAERELAPHATAWVRRTGDVVGLVVLRDHTSDDALAALGRLAERVGQPIGVSAIVPGLAAVDQGYQQASLVLRSLGRRPEASSFDARLPEALLLSSPAIAARLMDRWLGPVLALPTGEADALLDTLAAWVEFGGSASRTALAVPCHRNTVLNRIRRVSEVTGRRLDDGGVPVELDLALRAWRLR